MDFTEAIQFLQKLAVEENNWRSMRSQLPELFAAAEKAQRIVRDFDREMEQRKGVNVQLEARVAELQRENTDLKKQRSASEADLKERDKEKATRLGELDRQIATKEKELDAKQKRMAEIDDKLEAFKSQLQL